MSKLHERMKVARKHLGLSQTALAESAGMSLQGYQPNERGVTMPSAKILGAFCSMGINGHWLLTGQGEMLLEDCSEDRSMDELIKAAEEALWFIEKRTKGLALDVKDGLKMALYDSLEVPNVEKLVHENAREPSENELKEETPPAIQPEAIHPIMTRLDYFNQRLWRIESAVATLVNAKKERKSPLIKRIWEAVSGN